MFKFKTHKYFNSRLVKPVLMTELLNLRKR